MAWANHVSVMPRASWLFQRFRCLAMTLAGFHLLGVLSSLFDALVVGLNLAQSLLVDRGFRFIDLALAATAACDQRGNG